MGRVDDDLYKDVFEPYGVDIAQFYVLMSSGTRFRGPKGATIVEAGVSCDKFYLILRGEAVAREGRAEGKPVCRYPGRVNAYPTVPDVDSDESEPVEWSTVPQRGCVIAGSGLVDASRFERRYPNHVSAMTDVEWIQWDTAKLTSIMGRRGWRGTQAALFSLLYTELIGSLDRDRAVLTRQERAAAAEQEQAVPTPKFGQLMALSAFVAVPFFGFGFADNFIMIVCGDAIDATLGVRFGLTTMAAAGLGNWISDVIGLSLGDAIERGAGKIGLHNGGLTPAQQSMNVAKITTLLSKMVGISLGCFAGMLPLFFISTAKVEFTNQDLEVYNAIFGPFGVSTVEFAELMERGTRRRAAAGETVIGPDDPQKSVMLLLRGSVTASKGKDACRYVGRLGSGRVEEPEGKREVPLKGSIIGGAAIADPMLLDKPHEQSCVASTPVEWVEWNVDDLKTLMDEKPSIQASFFSMLYGELLSGLRTEERKQQLERYRAVLSAVLADGFVDETERSFVQEFYHKHEISEHEHITMLQDLGWTLQGWEKGCMERPKADVSQLRDHTYPSASQQKTINLLESAQELERAADIIDSVLAGLRKTLRGDASAS